MTQASPRPPTTLQPRPKANSTLTSSSLDTQAPSRTPRPSRPSSESRQSVSSKTSSVDNVSDRAVTAFVRRVLCSPAATSGVTEARPIEDLLPPLTSSNEVDLQLYAIIAVVVKETVHSWYGKITSDQMFVEEVVRIIAHCTRGLEDRLRNVDLESLVFDEIPELIESHILGSSPSPTLDAFLKLTCTGGSISNQSRVSSDAWNNQRSTCSVSQAESPSSIVTGTQSIVGNIDHTTTQKRGRLQTVVGTRSASNPTANRGFGEHLSSDACCRCCCGDNSWKVH